MEGPIPRAYFFQKLCPHPLILPISVNDNFIHLVVENMVVVLDLLLFLSHLTAQSTANSVGSTVEIYHKIAPFSPYPQPQPSSPLP